MKEEEEEEENNNNWDLQGEQSSGRNIFFFGVQLFEEKNLPNLECLSWRIQASFPAKTSDVTYICDSFSRGTQAQTDAVIGGERSKALGLGLSSRIDTATTSLPSAMVGNKKEAIGKAPVAKKPEKKISEDAENDMSLRRRYKLSPSSQHKNMEEWSFVKRLPNSCESCEVWNWRVCNSKTLCRMLHHSRYTSSLCQNVLCSFRYVYLAMLGPDFLWGQRA